MKQLQTICSAIILGAAIICFSSCSSEKKIDRLIDKYEKVCKEAKSGDIEKLVELEEIAEELAGLKDKMTEEQALRLAKAAL